MKNKSRVTKVILTAMVLLSMLLLSACELSKATPPPQPTLAVPINTVVVEDAAEEEASVEDSIEIIDTPEAEEETDADAKDVEEGEEAEDTAGEETEAETEEEAEEVEAEEEEPAEAEVPEIEVPETYTLMKDEFPYCIARRFDVNITELLNLNGLGGGVTYEGMVLKIPQDSAWNESAHGARSLRAHPVVYTVSAGDSIYSIACKFGDVSPAQIAAKNGLAEPFSLSPGQELQIP